MHEIPEPRSHVTATFMPAGEDALTPILEAGKAWFDAFYGRILVRHRARAAEFGAAVLKVDA